MTSQSRLVAAIGHTFDLSIESELLAAAGIDLVDGRTLETSDAAWANVSGVLLGTASRLDAAAIARMPQLRGIMRYGMGYDNVDMAAAKTAGVTVGIVRDYCVDEVAEHALAGAMSLARALPTWDRNVRAGKWRAGAMPRMRRLSALCFGVAGYGLIGRAAASKAKPLFGEVLIYDPLFGPDKNVVDGYRVAPSFDHLLASVDVLTLHVPLTENTRNMINSEALGKMRRDAIIINASRGGLINESDLDNALNSGHIGGAAIDTFSSEPVRPDNPLLSNARVLLSPHVAWMSEQAEATLRSCATRDIVSILQGGSPTTPVP